MRILYISNEYPPETGFGGIGTYTKYAAEGMAALGHRVTVICRSISTKNRQYTENGVDIYRVPMEHYPLPQGKRWYPVRRLAYALFPHYLVNSTWGITAWHAYTNLCNKEYSFDIIEYPECSAEGYYFGKWYGNGVARLHTPWSMVRDLDRLKERLTDRVLHDFAEYRSVLKARGISSPSCALKSIIEKRWHFRNISVYPNPIDISHFRLTSYKGGWIYTGRIERRKGVHTLIEAYAKVCTTQSLPKLTLIGRPFDTTPEGASYVCYINNLIRTQGLQNDIEWVQGVEYSKIGAILKRAQVAFFPSLWENFSYACLEAMASGLAVVASNTGGFSEMINDGQDGILFPTENADALAWVMRCLAESPSRIKKLGANARKTVKGQFATSVICKKAENFYWQLIQDDKRNVRSGGRSQK